MRNLTKHPVAALAALALLASGASAPAGVPDRPAVAGAGGTAGGSHPDRGCAAPALLFCEDFDLLPTGGAASLDWGVDSRRGTLTVERRGVPGAGTATAGRPYGAGRGRNQVLHVHTEDNGRAFLRVDDFAAPGNRFFGRMRLRVDAFPTAPDWAHFTLVEATGTGSAEVVRPIGGQFVPTLNRALWGIGADGGPTGDWTDWTASAPVTEDSWQCFEWLLDAADNRVAVWIDGVANPELTVSTDSHGGNDVPFVLPAVNTVKIGWQLYQGGTTPERFDLWIDDIALSAERVGC